MFLGYRFFSWTAYFGQNGVAVTVEDQRTAKLSVPPESRAFRTCLLHLTQEPYLAGLWTSAFNGTYLGSQEAVKRRRLNLEISCQEANPFRHCLPRISWRRDMRRKGAFLLACFRACMPACF